MSGPSLLPSQITLLAGQIAAGIHANPVACQAIQRDCERSGRTFVAEIAAISCDQVEALMNELGTRFQQGQVP
jgi:hypothetical protein